VGTTGNTEIACPGSNNQTYVAQNTSKYFKILCDVDYNSNAGADDIANVNADNMNECIDTCATHSDCLYVGWGSKYGANKCYMKTAIGKPNSSPGWYFAIEMEGSPT
jgi:PAN domain